MLQIKMIVAYLCLACLVMVGRVPEAWAIGSFHPTKRELRSLPDYCGPRATTWGNDLRVPEVRQWADRFGKNNWIHMHHLCDALLQMQRVAVPGTPEIQKRANLSEALKNIDYSMRRSTVDFVLWPMMLLKKGEILEDLGEDEKAGMLYIRALRKDRCNPTIYERLASYYERYGEHDEAVKMRGYEEQARGTCSGKNAGKKNDGSRGAGEKGAVADAETSGKQ